MRNDLYSFLNDFNNMFYDGGYKGFPIDVVEVENGYQVECEMPGVKKEDVKVTFENGELTIEASPKKEKDRKYLIHERSAQKLRRTINMGNDVDDEKITAKFENGILVINLFNKEVKAHKQIVIE